MRLGLIGCGGRGTGTAVQALNACKRAELVAMGDAFQDRLDESVQAVEYTYRDGAKMFLFCRHIPNCWTSGGGVAHGTKGEADLGKGELRVRGQEPVRFERGVAGHQQEHHDLFAAIDAGRPYNEGDFGITSTMTAILGRMATYSGQVVKWDDAMQSSTDLQPERYAWDAQPKVKAGPDGLYPCAVPGQAKPY